MNVKDEKTKQAFTYWLAMGKTQKEVAKIIGISEKTAGRWRKEMSITGYLTLEKGYLKRLQAMMNRPDTPEIDIYNLTNSLAAVRKIIERYLQSYQKSIKTK